MFGSRADTIMDTRRRCRTAIPSASPRARKRVVPLSLVGSLPSMTVLTHGTSDARGRRSPKVAPLLQHRRLQKSKSELTHFRDANNASPVLFALGPSNTSPASARVQPTRPDPATNASGSESNGRPPKDVASNDLFESSDSDPDIVAEVDMAKIATTSISSWQKAPTGHMPLQKKIQSMPSIPPPERTLLLRRLSHVLEGLATRFSAFLRCVQNINKDDIAIVSIKSSAAADVFLGGHLGHSRLTNDSRAGDHLQRSTLDFLFRQRSAQQRRAGAKRTLTHPDADAGTPGGHLGTTGSTSSRVPRSRHVLYTFLAHVDSFFDGLRDWWNPQESNGLSTWCDLRLAFFVNVADSNLDEAVRAILVIGRRVLQVAHVQFKGSRAALRDLFQHYVHTALSGICMLSLHRILARNIVGTETASRACAHLKEYLPRFEDIARQWRHIDAECASVFAQQLEVEIRGLVVELQPSLELDLPKLHVHKRIASVIAGFVQSKYEWLRDVTVLVYRGVGSEESHAVWAPVRHNGYKASSQPFQLLAAAGLLMVPNVAGLNLVVLFDSRSQENGTQSGPSPSDNSTVDSAQSSDPTANRTSHHFLSYAEELAATLHTPLSRDEITFYGTTQPEGSEAATVTSLQHAAHLCSWMKSNWAKKQVGDPGATVSAVVVLHRAHCLEQIARASNEVGEFLGTAVETADGDCALPPSSPVQVVQCGSYNVYVRFA